MGIDPDVVEMHIQRTLVKERELLDVEFPIIPDSWDYRMKTDMAGTLAREWQRYAHTRKKHQPNKPLTMGDFGHYIVFWYGTYIYTR